MWMKCKKVSVSKYYPFARIAADPWDGFVKLLLIEENKVVNQKEGMELSPPPGVSSMDFSAVWVNQSYFSFQHRASAILVPVSLDFLF
jgi:hypothetical protein